MPKNPLVEVFGYPIDNMSSEAISHRQGRLCPYHNSSGINCTKNSATDPLGVCTVVDGNSIAITCPIRLRQDYLIVADAAEFFFAPQQKYVALTEVRLNDRNQKSAGNIDIVLIALDDNNQIIDFGALEIQAVYISGNVSKAFKKYMEDPASNFNMEWPSKNYPKADYLSSSRKRLAPQLIYKGGILNAWDKKLAVAVHKTFFELLPTLQEVDPVQADIAWFIYDLRYDEALSRYRLERINTRYTKFRTALDTITNPEPGEISSFVRYLNERLIKGKFMGTPLQEIPPVIAPLAEEFDSNFETGEDADGDIDG